MLTWSIDLGTMSAFQLFRLCLLFVFLQALSFCFPFAVHARAIPDSPPSHHPTPEVHCDRFHYVISFLCSNSGPLALTLTFRS
jgi:hypothetical protein